MNEEYQKQLALIQGCLRIFYKFDDIRGLEFTQQRIKELKRRFDRDKQVKGQEKDMVMQLMSQMSKGIEAKMQSIKPTEVEICPVPDNHIYQGEK